MFRCYPARHTLLFYILTFYIVTCRVLYGNLFPLFHTKGVFLSVLVFARAFRRCFFYIRLENTFKRANGLLQPTMDYNAAFEETSTKCSSSSKSFLLPYFHCLHLRQHLICSWYTHHTRVLSLAYFFLYILYQFLGVKDASIMLQ